ncbi:hypothetical protein CGLO_15111 [Colletotrichum gloeosporioides Cg-14]
MSTYI